MAAKPAKRNWNDVQTAIATAAIVTTLGMWNLFAAPAETVTAQTQEPTLPPTEPPTEVPAEPTAMPYVKIMFTPMATEVTSSVPQTQQEVKKKKKKRRNGGGGGGGSNSGGGSVTQTQSS